VSRLKIVVDFDQCEANGVCVKLAPELFRLDDQDSLEVLEEYPADELRAKAEDAAKHCPRRAISLVEE
jgi:ferredoxin